ncbi:MAG TPA: tripartite tricarboxylate transporter substrate binding protein [Noviherbaspirillum sp.]
MKTRTLITRLFAGALLATVGVGAAAQNYPDKPIRMILPYAPGGITDLAARLAAQHMSTQLGQQVMVENRGGAGTRIGVGQVAKAEPDGYTILYVNSVTHGSMPAMSKSLPFDPVKDFAPIAPLFVYTSTLVCHPSVPWNSVKEMIAYAKANPGAINNATAGPGTGHDLMGNLLNTMAGIKTTQVHYRGAGPALQDVLAGNAHCIFGGGDVKQYVVSGKLKALATSGMKRDDNFPGVPTMDEAGVKGYDISWWQGLAAPAKTPQPVLAKLTAAAQAALKEPDLQKRAGDLNLDVLSGGPAELAKLINDDMAKYARIVKEADIPLQ